MLPYINTVATYLRPILPTYNNPQNARLMIFCLYLSLNIISLLLQHLILWHLSTLGFGTCIMGFAINFIINLINHLNMQLELVTLSVHVIFPGGVPIDVPMRKL